LPVDITGKGQRSLKNGGGSGSGNNTNNHNGAVESQKGE